MTVLIPLDRITDNPWQTRQAYDQAYIQDELAPSIERSGLLQTPTARLVNGAGAGVDVDGIDLMSQSALDALLQDKPGWRIQLAFAHNRRRAFDHLAAQGQAVPGVARAGHMPLTLRPLTDHEMADQAWSENERGSDLNAVERARAVDRRMNDFTWTQKEAAAEMGLSRSRIANLLRLLKLSDAVLDALSNGTITERSASALVPLFTLEEPLASSVRTHERQGWTEGRKRAWKEHVVFDDLVEATVLGHLRSDEIRDRVRTLLEHVTEPLGLVDVEHDYGAEGVAAMRQGLCKGCPLLVETQQVRNFGKEKVTVFRCGDEACHEEKAARAAAVLLQATQEKTDLPITAEEDREQTTTFDDYGSGKKLAKRLLKKGCPSGHLHLRLAGRYPDFCLPGHDNAELVCLHAPGGHCACQGDRASNKKAQQTAAARETKTGRARARLLGEERYAQPAKQALAGALLAHNMKAWDVVLRIVRSGPNTSWSWEGEQARRGFFEKKDARPATFEDLCRRLAAWTCDIETHHHDWPDALDRVEQFADRRMTAMGLSCDAVDYGAVDIEAVADLATLSLKEDAFAELLQTAGAETLHDVQRRITDEKGDPTRGHKARLAALRKRLAEIEEPEAVPA